MELGETLDLIDFEAAAEVCYEGAYHFFGEDFSIFTLVCYDMHVAGLFQVEFFLICVSFG